MSDRTGTGVSPRNRVADIITVDLAALRKLAEEATPGPWRVSMSGYSVKSEDAGMPIVAARPVDVERWLPNADFIAALNPSTVLALLDELRAVTMDRDACADERDVWERREKEGNEATRGRIAQLEKVAEAALAYIQHYTTGTMGALWLALSNAGYVPTPSNMP